MADVGARGYSERMLSSLLRSLPYLVHTNRELGLMLRGKKPLASFVDGKDCFPEVVTRYLKLFDRYVAEGRILREDHFSEVSGRMSYISVTGYYLRFRERSGACRP